MQMQRAGYVLYRALVGTAIVQIDRYFNVTHRISLMHLANVM